MNTRKNILLALLSLLILLFAVRAEAQFMPTVYDNVYGKDVRFTKITAGFQSGDVVTVGESGGQKLVSWLNRWGESRLSRKFQPDMFNDILDVIPVDESSILIVGTRQVSGKDPREAGGQAIVFTSAGKIKHDISVGRNGTRVTGGRVLHSGNIVLYGDTPTAANGKRAGFVCKISPKDQLLYIYTATAGETCVGIDVSGSSEYVTAAFSAGESEGSSVVRLDEFGKPFYITQLPDRTFRIEKMVATTDGEVYLVGEGQKTGGAVIKIRVEGAIVYQKQVIPVAGETRFHHLIVCPTGEIFAGGNDLNNSYYVLLRPDGTELTSNIDKGIVAGITNNPSNGDCVVSLYDPLQEKGKIAKISNQGRRLYEKVTATAYTELRIDRGGDLLMASPSTGRLTMLSALGELLFDRYVVEGVPARFAAVTLPANGEAVFLGEPSRVAKLAHGVYVSDILVNKPINGTTMATFTVTLSGYAFSGEGAPLPVTVDYKTTPGSAAEGRNFDPVSGTLSFVPSSDGSNRYLNKFTVEVPVNANDLLEGNRVFSLDLAGVKNSYLIRNSAKATIEDQPALVRLLGTRPGVEGESDVIYELGIFKTNGRPLTNASRADIVVDGVYGMGTADGLDFDLGRTPRVVIKPEMHSGSFNVVTKEDTRFEAEKSVIIDFNKIYAMSDLQLSFGTTQLSCEGKIKDQAAMIAIESLGDFGRKNSVVSGFFKISLLRAKDGALQTNNSGSDITVTAMVDTATTARQGIDFVLTNMHDLRIWGDGRSSTVNLNGVVLYSASDVKQTVSVMLTGVKGGENTGKITVFADKAKAWFTIKE